MEPERRRYPRMREVVFRVLVERPGHLEAQAVGAAFSAGVTLLSRVNPLGRLASIKLAGEWI